MIEIGMHKIYKNFGYKQVLKDINFEILTGDRVGIVGKNGSGKSTLFKMIMKKEFPDTGNITIRKQATIGYLEQIPTISDNDITVKDMLMSSFFEIHAIEQRMRALEQDMMHNNVDEAILNKYAKIQDQYIALGGYEVEEKLNKVITGFKLHSILDKPFAILSGGQKTIINLAQLILTEPDILLLDEPTNHLDNEMIEYLERYLIKFNKAIFMVTHDRYFLERITNKIFELDRTKIYEYEANYSHFLELKAQREEIALSTQRKRKLFLKKELEWVRAGVQARSTKSKDRLQRFEELNNQKDIEKIQNVEMLSVSSRLGKKTIELEDVSMSYDHLLFEPFSYHFKRNDRVGILGKNGCGKSTLLNIIAGIIKPTYGQVIIGDTIKIGYFKQGHGDMDPSMRVIDYIKETANVLKTSDGQLSAKQMCEKFLFESDMQYTPIERLSGGEKRRLYLLKILMSAPNVLLLDEPTNDLDIMTLQILEDYLDHFNGIILTVSHDRYFLDRICDELFVFKDQKITYHIGGYSEYIDLESSSKKTKVTTSQAPRERKKKIKLSYKEKQELDTLEQLVPQLEQQIKDIDKKMDGVIEFDIIQAMLKERDSLSLQLEESEMRWMELLEKQEQNEK